MSIDPFAIESLFVNPIRQTRIVPMPKRICVNDHRIRALSAARDSGIVTDIDASTLALQKRVRNLPPIHRLWIDPDSNSLGYTQRYAKGNPSELHFLDPGLNLVQTVQLGDACNSFAHRNERWIVACRNGGIYCFDPIGNLLWIWNAPLDRHFKSPKFSVAASDQLVFAAEGLYLYALTPEGSQLWDWQLPNRHEQTQEFAIPVGNVSPSNRSALETLGLKGSPTREDIRQAYRRMARLTHPDLKPNDLMASARFRSVQDAYECLATESMPEVRRAGSIEMTVSLLINGRPVTACITSLDVRGASVAIGTSEGEIYLCDNDGNIRTYHQQLGRQGVSSVLLRDGRIDAAFCYPRLYRFGGESPAVSEDLPEYSVSLVQHGDDVLVYGWKTIWLFDRDARLAGCVGLERKIEGAAASRRETFVLAGTLMAIPYRQQTDGYAAACPR